MSAFIYLSLLFGFAKAAVWDYANITAWNSIDPKCAQPSHQSPRALNRSVAITAPQCHDLIWQNSQPRTFDITNNGHTLTYTPRLNSGETTANRFSWGNAFWCLVQFHMHWSQDDHGAEHRLENYDNGLEVHFVHRRCDYATLGAAVAEDNNVINTIAVIGVLYHVGPDDLMGSLINTSIITPNLTRKNGFSVVSDFPYTQMLPSLPARRFYNYQGSLTTPTCDPVLWFVVEAQQNVSAAEMALLRTIQDSSGQPILHNQRPLQANNQSLYYFEPCPAVTCPTSTAAPNSASAANGGSSAQSCDNNCATTGSIVAGCVATVCIVLVLGGVFGTMHFRFKEESEMAQSMNK